MPALDKFKQFKPGDVVYARFLGSQTFLIVEDARAVQGFPCYLCHGEDDASYLIPKIYLSSKNLLPLVENGNHRQIALPLVTEGAGKAP